MQSLYLDKPMRSLYLVAAIVLLGIALAFGCQRGYHQVRSGMKMSPTQSVGGNVAVAPNNKAGLASLGFAIAGGLSLVSAAIVGRNHVGPQPLHKEDAEKIVESLGN